MKEVAWMIPVALLWYIAAGMSFENMLFWKSLLVWFCVYMSLRAIHWGLKRDSKPEKMPDINIERQHVYIFTYAEPSELIMDAWVCSVPDEGGEIIIFIKGEYKRYYLRRRIYGMNADYGTACWNLYVDEQISD